jgi:hypothetical protein
MIRRLSFLAGLTAFALTAGPLQALVLDFSREIAFENFESYAPGTRPPTMTNGTAMLWNPEVKVDSTEVFGAGTDNQYLSYYKTRNVTLPFALGAEATDVVRLSFDFVPRQNGPDTFNGTAVGTDAQWMNINFLSASDTNPSASVRSHLTSLQPWNTRTRAAGSEVLVQFPPLDVVKHFDMFLNNTAAEIQYRAPDNSTVTLGAGLMAMWIDGVLVATYNNERAAGTLGQLIHTINFAIDSNLTRIISFDIDNIGIYGVIPEPATYALLLGAGFLGIVLARRRRS